MQLVLQREIDGLERGVLFAERVECILEVSIFPFVVLFDEKDLVDELCVLRVVLRVER